MRYLITTTLLLVGLTFKTQPAFCHAPSKKVEQAFALIDKGNAKAAAVILEQLIKEYPNDDSIRINLAQCYFMNGQRDRAIAQFESLRRKTGTISAIALLDLSKIYSSESNFVAAGKLLLDTKLKLLPRTFAEEYRDQLEKTVNGLRSEFVKLASAGKSNQEIRALLEVLDSPDYINFGVALTHIANNRKSEARTLLQSLISNTDDNFLKERASTLLKALESRATKERRFHLEADLSHGHNTNSNQSHDLQESRQESQLYLGFSSSLWNLSSFNSQIKLAAFHVEPNQEKETRNSNYTVVAPFGTEIGQFQFRLAPLMQYQNFSSEFIAIRHGFQARVARPFDPFEVSIIYDLRRSVAQSSNYEYLNGYSQNEKLVLTYEQNFLLSVGLIFVQENYGDLLTPGGSIPLTFKGQGVEVIGELPIGRGFQLTSSTSYFYKSYQGPALPLVLERVDIQSHFLGKISYEILSDVSIYFHYEWDNNQSTLDNRNSPDNKNFVQNIFMVGLQWLKQI